MCIFGFYGIVNDYVRLFDRKKTIKSVNITFYLKNNFSFLVTLHVSDSPVNYNDTVYVHLDIYFAPNWVQRLVDSMNVSIRTYNSQVHYFQSIDLVLNISNVEVFFSKGINVVLPILSIQYIN